MEIQLSFRPSRKVGMPGKRDKGIPQMLERAEGYDVTDRACREAS